MDTLRLTGIRPQAQGQDGSPSHVGGLRADVAVTFDMRAAAHDDDITATVDYAQLASRVANVLAQRGAKVTLLETLASEVVDAVLLSHQVISAAVTVYAEHPQGVCAEEVSVSIERKADGAGVGVPDSVDDIGSDHANISAAAQVAAKYHEDNQQAARGGVDPREQPGKRAGFSDAVIWLVSNQQPCEPVFRAAIVGLDGVPANQVNGISPLYHISNITGSDEDCAVVMLSTRLDAQALEQVCNTIAHGEKDALRMHVISIQSQEDEHNMEIRYPEAAQTAAVLAPWMDIDEQARLGKDPVSFLLAMAPDADRVGMLSDGWILGGEQ